MKNKQPHPLIDHIKLSDLQRKVLWIFIGMILLSRLITIIEIPLMDTTEARYGEIARKMVETNDWITPQFDYGVWFWGQPPLHTWVSALGMKLFGVSAFAARIFIFVSGCGLLALLYRWVQREKGRGYALVGTAVLASSGLFYVAMGSVMTDLVMTCGTCLSMIAFWNALRHDPDNNPHPRRRLWGYLFFVGLAIGLLAKGPAATVLTAIPIFLWVLLSNQWVRTWKDIPWLTGGALALVITLPWYIAAELKTPGFIEYFIVGEHYQRFVVSGWEGDLYGSAHDHKKGAIWLYALMCFLPWTPMILAPLLRFKKMLPQLKPRSNPWLFYLLCWAVSTMLFFTMATNILPTYVITGVPAGCFLAIELWVITRDTPLTRKRSTVRFFAGSAIVSLILYGGAFLVLEFDSARIERKSQVVVVAKTQELREGTDGGLYYFSKRPFSAEFYSQGKAVLIKNEDQLDEVLSNGTRDCVVIKHRQRIPDQLATSFTFIEKMGKRAIYYENAPEVSE